VFPSLEHFGLIVPCGLVDTGVTSLRRLDIPHPPIEKIAANLGRRLAEALQTH
jgi:lipoate-protein ligase B